MMTGRSKDDRAPVELVWEAPPERTRTVRSMYDAALPEIKKTPGRWARVRVVGRDSAHSTLQNLKKITSGDEHWESVTRPLNGSTTEWGVWVRYRTPEQLRAVKR